MNLKLSDLPDAFQKALGGGAKKPSKYRNRRTVVDGIAFDSKKEADYYAQLELERRAGSVLLFVRQPSFVLEGGVVYRADFLVIRPGPEAFVPPQMPDLGWRRAPTSVAFDVIDVKSPATAKDKAYRIKKRQFEARYGIQIREV